MNKAELITEVANRMNMTKKRCRRSSEYGF